MLSFDNQKQLLQSFLHQSTNKHCADCQSSTPTWASLDFGVFVCSNCSGAHRALGPTITRIKSITLDQWKEIWIQNMRIGNQEINRYWEADWKNAELKKPKIGASLDEHKRFIDDKYIRRKFVVDKNVKDPLTQYKNRKNVNMSNVNTEKRENMNIHLSEPQPNLIPIGQILKKTQSQKLRENINLLDDSFLNQRSVSNNVSNNDSENYPESISHKNKYNNIFNQNCEQHTHETKKTNPITEFPEESVSKLCQKDSNKITFDELLKNPQITSPPIPQNFFGAFSSSNTYQQFTLPLHNNNYNFIPQNISLTNQQPYKKQFNFNPYLPSYNLYPVKPQYTGFVFN